MFENSCQVHNLLPQFHLSEADTADVKQIIDEPHHVFNLPLHNLQRLIYSRLIVLRQSHDLHRISDRRKRIPQLVSESRKEFVFAHVGIFQGGFTLSQRGFDTCAFCDFLFCLRVEAGIVDGDGRLSGDT